MDRLEDHFGRWKRNLFKETDKEKRYWRAKAGAEKHWKERYKKEKERFKEEAASEFGRVKRLIMRGEVEGAKVLAKRMRLKIQNPVKSKRKPKKAKK